MTNINISVPESLKSFIDHEIVEGGYSSAGEYLQLQLNHFAKKFSRYAREIRQEKSKRAKAHSAIKSSPHHYIQPENQYRCRSRRGCCCRDKQNGNPQD